MQYEDEGAAEEEEEVEVARAIAVMRSRCFAMFKAGNFKSQTMPERTRVRVGVWKRAWLLGMLDERGV